MKAVGSTVFVLALALGGSAEDLKFDADSQYVVLATNRTRTMQKELDTAAKQGFRVVTAMQGGGEIVVLMERLAQSAQPQEYRILATHRASTMEKELNEAGSQGFRYVPQTAFEKGDEGIIIMERAPNSDIAYEYRLLATHRTSTLAKELNEVARQKFFLRGSFNREEKMAVVERSSVR